MGQPTFWDNPEKAREVINQLKPINGLLKPYEELASTAADLQALVELAEEDEGEEIERELERELVPFEKRLDDFELRSMLDGSQDASNAYLRVQAGTGGTEACDWAQMLVRMYGRWAETQGFTVEIVDELPNEEAGIRSTTLRIVGDYAYGYLQGESGVHRLVRISPFDANARRQTSFAAVDVTPEIDGTIEIEIRDDDLEREVFRSGGPGGQHQNKTESGVRFRHKPTEITAESRSQRSQHKNAETALKMLKAKLYKIEEQKRLAEVQGMYDEKGEVAWGNQIRNYVMQPYTLVKDVRTDVQTPQVQAVLDGGLDEFIQAYLRYKAEARHRSSVTAEKMTR
jgi:peptide chain release factor 2